MIGLELSGDSVFDFGAGTWETLGRLQVHENGEVIAF